MSKYIENRKQQLNKYGWKVIFFNSKECEDDKLVLEEIRRVENG